MNLGEEDFLVLVWQLFYKFRIISKLKVPQKTAQYKRVSYGASSFDHYLKYLPALKYQTNSKKI